MREIKFTIYKHTKGFPDYLDYDLNDYEDFGYFHTRSEAESCAEIMNLKQGKDYNYYVVMV